MKERVEKPKKGQVVVEMLLILPVFLTIIFSIMEMGRVAFWVLMLNHATYECARIGAMKATPFVGGGPMNVDATLRNVMERAWPNVPGSTELPTITSAAVPHPFSDNQSQFRNSDLVVTSSFKVPLIFPLASAFLAEPKGSGFRTITAEIRMPIEAPQTN